MLPREKRAKRARVPMRVLPNRESFSGMTGLALHLELTAMGILVAHGACCADSRELPCGAAAAREVVRGYFVACLTCKRHVLPGEREGGSAMIEPRHRKTGIGHRVARLT